MEAVAELTGRGHPEAHRYRWNYFLAALAAAGRQAGEAVRSTAVAVRVGRWADEKAWRAFLSDDGEVGRKTALESQERIIEELGGLS